VHNDRQNGYNYTRHKTPFTAWWISHKGPIQQ
jgi:hypothetical protein